MNKKHAVVSGVLAAFFLSGCMAVRECGKTLWGSSTRALEKARAHALTDKFRCGVEDCYRAALELTGPSPEPQDGEPEEPRMELFLKKDSQHMFVVMGVPGSIDTTEVGVFCSPEGGGVVRVEVSSLSANARSRVAEQLFPFLSSRFPPVMPDKTGENPG